MRYYYMDMYHLRNQISKASEDKTTFVNYYIKFTDNNGYTDRKQFTSKEAFEKYAEAIKNSSDITEYEISMVERKVANG